MTQGERTSDPLPECPECSGRTIEFRGSGLDMQHKICSRWREPGHLSKDDVNAKLAAHIKAIRPSGRYA